LGVKSTSFGRRFVINADVFYIDWSEIQLQGFFPGTFFGYTFNGGKAKSQGVEGELEFHPVEGLTISASAAYTDAKLTTTPGQGFPGMSGDPLPYSSKFTGSLSAEERFHVSDSVTGFVGATAAYVGKRYGAYISPPPTFASIQPAVPSYAYGNVDGGLVFAGYTVTAFVKNVTNERGLVAPPYFGGVGFGPPGAWQVSVITPRTVGISITKEFK
jgi:outer membrane receptor protein involved in Fe transport